MLLKKERIVRDTSGRSLTSHFIKSSKEEPGDFSSAPLLHFGAQWLAYFYPCQLLLTGSLAAIRT
jgi:hypothetical protein